MSKKFEDYYLILEVHMLASASVIKAAYKKLCKLNHPDNGGNSEYLKKIQEAYDVLIDVDKRKDYQKEWKNNCLKHQEGFKEFLEDNIYDISFKPLKQLIVEYMYLIKNKEFEMAYSILSESNKKKFLKKILYFGKS